MEEFPSLDVVSIRDICPKCIFSFGNCNGYEEQDFVSSDSACNHTRD